MQPIRVVVMAVFCLFVFSPAMQAQRWPQNEPLLMTKIDPFCLSITTNKTSNIIFPYSIKSIDRGSEAVLVQKALGVNNILQLKASGRDFPATNVTVVTGDGRFYSFVVAYDSIPPILNFSFTKDSANLLPTAAIAAVPTSEHTQEKIAKRILNTPSFVYKTTKAQRMQFTLRRILLVDEAMWFLLRLKNKSLIDYRLDAIRFFIRDRQRAKRTATQEKEIVPIYTLGNSGVIGDSSAPFVLAFTPFTIPPSQELVIQVQETTGGRTLTLHVSNSMLLRAKRLNNLSTQ